MLQNMNSGLVNYIQSTATHKGHCFPTVTTWCVMLLLLFLKLNEVMEKKDREEKEEKKERKERTGGGGRQGGQRNIPFMCA